MSKKKLLLTFYDLALGVCLAGLDDVVAGGEELEAVLLAAVGRVPHPDVLEGDDAPGLLVGGELEVVEAVVVEDEPAALPALVAPALLPQPALAVGVEERVHQVVAVVLRDLERLRLDAIVQALKIIEN